MSSETTLFSHIVRSKLEGQVENTAVEALGYILSRSEAARKAQVETLRTGEMNINSIARVETQITGKEGERPDLVCYDGDGYGNVLIEAKFWAELTDNQPNQYLLKLSRECQERAAVLLFVAPKIRLESLWQELCGKAKKKFALTVVSDSGPVRSASIGDDVHYLQLVSWPYLLDRMAEAARNDDDSGAVADIRQLRGLTDHAEPDPSLPWRPGKLEAKLAKRIVALKRLIDDATDCGKNAGFLARGAVKKGYLGGEGRTFEIGGVWAWFGFEVFAWANYDSTPLWLRFGRDKCRHLKEAELIEKLFDPGQDWDFRMPIELPVGVDYDEMLDSVVNRLDRIARRLDPKIAPVALDRSSTIEQRKSADRIDAYAFQPWRSEELEPKHAQGLMRLHKIIDKAIKFGESAGIVQQAKNKPSRDGYGWSIQLAGVEMWFGADAKAWAQHCITPLWLEFEHQEQREVAFVTDVSKKVGWKHCIPIDVPATAEDDKVLNSVVASLTNIAKRFEAPDP